MDNDERLTRFKSCLRAHLDACEFAVGRWVIPGPIAYIMSDENPDGFVIMEHDRDTFPQAVSAKGRELSAWGLIVVAEAWMSKQSVRGELIPPSEAADRAECVIVSWQYRDKHGALVAMIETDGDVRRLGDWKSAKGLAGPFAHLLDAFGDLSVN